jgi:hypothetical protein
LQSTSGDFSGPDEIAIQHKHLQFGHGFRVVLGDGHSQAAQMTLAPGETEGGPHTTSGTLNSAGRAGWSLACHGMS